jgi:hypothetical protein
LASKLVFIVIAASARANGPVVQNRGLKTQAKAGNWPGLPRRDLLHFPARILGPFDELAGVSAGSAHVPWQGLRLSQLIAERHR